MKKMYWRPKSVSRTALALIAAGALSGYVLVEKVKLTVRQPFFKEKLQAARLAKTAFDAVRKERLRRRMPIDVETDPAQSGLIGTLMTPVTTNPGSLASKRTAVNPNFAAIVVHYLMRAGVTEGDVVAVGYSGSFPAINIAVLSAIETLKLKPIVISSAASSQWGANEPGMLWPDIERVLLKRKIISYGSVAASIGGIEDRGLGMSKRGRRILLEAIDRQGITLIDPDTFAKSVETRMKIYQDHADGAPIKVYVNVGGGTISVGRKFGKRLFKPGLNRRVPPAGSSLESVMSSFLEAGVPVIHLVKINQLATRFGLPEQPIPIPDPGQGAIYIRREYNRYLVFGLLVGVIGALYLFVRSDLGFRLTRGPGMKKQASGTPEPMV